MIKIISALSKFCDLRLTERLGVVLIKHKAIVCSLAQFQTYIITITLVHWADLVTKSPEGNKRFPKCICTLSHKSVAFFLCIFKYLKKNAFFCNAHPSLLTAGVQQRCIMHVNSPESLEHTIVLLPIKCGICLNCGTWANSHARSSPIQLRARSHNALGGSLIECSYITAHQLGQDGQTQIMWIRVRV